MHLFGWVSSARTFAITAAVMGTVVSAVVYVVGAAVHGAVGAYVGGLDLLGIVQLDGRALTEYNALIVANLARLASLPGAWIASLLP